MIIIGLTGSMGSGKTTAAGFLKNKCAIVLDADEIARQQYKPGTKCWREIKKYFGAGVLNEDNTINRRLLTQIVFAEKERLNKLCAIVHPAVIREIKNRLKAIKRKKRQAVVVIDAPLLFETGLNKIADFTVCVWLPRRLQMERILARGDLTMKQALARLKIQMPAAQKKIKSDFAIDNSGSFSKMQKQIDSVFEKIKKIKSKK